MAVLVYILRTRHLSLLVFGNPRAKIFVEENEWCQKRLQQQDKCSTGQQLHKQQTSLCRNGKLTGIPPSRRLESFVISFLSVFVAKDKRRTGVPSVQRNTHFQYRGFVWIAVEPIWYLFCRIVVVVPLLQQPPPHLTGKEAQGRYDKRIPKHSHQCYNVEVCRVASFRAIDRNPSIDH